MAKGILQRLADGVVLGDGGYIVELEQRGWVVTGAFTPEVALEHPAAVRELYSEMANAGAEVLQVMAFYGSRAKLDTVGKGAIVKSGVWRSMAQAAYRREASVTSVPSWNLAPVISFESWLNPRSRCQRVCALIESL